MISNNLPYPICLSSSKVGAQYVCYARWFILVCFFWLVSSAAFSDPVDVDKFRVSGYATLGLTKSGDKNLGHRRNIDQDGNFDGDFTLETDSVLGLQIEMDLSQSLTSAFQVVGRDRTDDSINNSVEWAYLRYRINPSFTARAGRIGLDMFLLSDHRNVGFAYPWARPPNEFYAPFGLRFVDGAEISYRKVLSKSVVTGSLIYGDIENQVSFNRRDIEVEFENVIGGNVVWESEVWKLKYSFLLVNNDGNTKEEIDLQSVSNQLLSASQVMSWPEAEDLAVQFSDEKGRHRYQAFGLEVNKYPWIIHSEINDYKSDLLTFRSVRGGYFSVGYRIEELTLFSFFSKSKPSEKRVLLTGAPSDFEALQQSVQRLLDVTSSDQETLGVGMKWNARHDLALKVQWERSDIAARSSFPWQTEQPVEEDTDIDTFSISLNYIFSL